MIDIHRSPDAALLLARLGAHAARRFAERLEPLRLGPPEAGVLRLVHQAPDSSQQDLARMLGLFPSRLVVIIDQLEADGLVVRGRSATDRRRNTITLSEPGIALLEQVAAVAAVHESDLCQGLDFGERAGLAVLLQKIAVAQGLTSSAQPGSEDIGRADQVRSEVADRDVDGGLLIRQGSPPPE